MNWSLGSRGEANLVSGITGTTTNDSELCVEALAREGVLADILPPHILNPCITERMYALRLVLPNHHIPQRRSREQVKHRIRIRSLPNWHPSQPSSPKNITK